MSNEAEGLTPQERAAKLAWYLSQGERLTTTEIACRLQMTRDGALKLLTRMSRVLSIEPGYDGKWERTTEIEANF